MAQSLSHILLHLVFSTRHREPLLHDDLLAPTHAYLAGILRELECPRIRIGGVEDHVHLLFKLSRNHSVADVVQTVKTGSSRWLKSQADHLHDFHWQSGYGVFSVSESQSSSVKSYIEEQRKRHRKLSFQDELRSLLKRHKVDYDEKYLWD